MSATQQNYSKTGRTIPRKHQKRRDWSLNTKGSRYRTLGMLLWNQRGYFFKGHLSIKCHSQNIYEYRLLKNNSIWKKWTRLGTHCAWPGDDRSLSLERIQSHSPKVTPLTYSAKITIQGQLLLPLCQVGIKPKQEKRSSQGNDTSSGVCRRNNR